jgi:hypothetical protein
MIVRKLAQIQKPVVLLFLILLSGFAIAQEPLATHVSNAKEVD